MDHSAAVLLSAHLSSQARLHSQPHFPCAIPSFRGTKHSRVCEAAVFAFYAGVPLLTSRARPRSGGLRIQCSLVISASSAALRPSTQQRVPYQSPFLCEHNNPLTEHHQTNSVRVRFVLPGSILFLLGSLPSFISMYDHPLVPYPPALARPEPTNRQRTDEKSHNASRISL